MRKLMLTLAVLALPLTAHGSGVLDPVWWVFMVLSLIRDSGGWYG